MIGLGLSLCGACVMADNDAVTEKPVYTSEYTRGYFIANATRAHRSSASSFALYTMSDSARLSEIKQRGVVFTNAPSPSGTIFAIWTKDVAKNATCRNLYANVTKGRGDLYVQVLSSVYALYHPSHFGIVDGTWDATNVTIHVSNATERLLYSVSVEEAEGVSNLLYRSFVNNSTQPEDALFKLAYTKKGNEYVQLVYPLSSVRSDTDCASINLVNCQKIEL